MTMVDPKSVFLNTFGHMYQTTLRANNLNIKKQTTTMTTTMKFVYFDSTKVVGKGQGINKGSTLP